ncbi:MAG: MerR family transcriptional regulator [Ghiorsea sp.]|nr:MerR family transcriptional regulator [Ghiorsea sp.]
MKIGELATKAKVNIDTIRYYERRDLLRQPKRSASGYRIYSATDVKRLLFIVHAKELGFTLEEIKTLLSLQSGRSNCNEVRQIATNKASEISLRIQSLLRIQNVLLELAEKCEQKGTNDSCPILNAMENDDE